ncbi:ATP synthase subunit [Capsaspora owczarzaki ATCC 30864]|uniref:V-type proton ATPase subunit n=1 Tax=Capsaspora owczarzaki (strain ATCC 30864) TaxID=595528 RepID=A0A0D2X472_CAPO3|nr:ATP synthase subunit [Capsaspora owczarzaki ATCC 30864]KJE95554.1 ATP synthase subunit [Capsaspora owczarzaki ATCC 30864]|eukprot:XP_004345587.1 ATP synthase subunit [Capsaspora owczarzaki ATCC 30864]
METDFLFNVNHGFIEGIVRGIRSGFLKQSEYLNMQQSANIDDFKLHLQSTDYGNMLANEPSPISVSTISDRLTERLVSEFHYIRNNSFEPLSKFLDFITYGYMIDNIVLLIQGTLHERDLSELLPKCHPLGLFESMGSITVASTPAELYNSVIVDTPLAPYFQSCISEQDLDELNVEIIRSSLYKAYLEDFYDFCEGVGSNTAETMKRILEFEADRRCFIITINSFGTELSKDDRAKLYPQCGRLYPDGLIKLARADDLDGVRAVAEYYAEYRAMFETSGSSSSDKTLEDRFFEYEVKLNELAFEQQYSFGNIYAMLRLKEQEARNIVWLAECISQNQRAKIDNYIPIFK